MKKARMSLRIFLFLLTIALALTASLYLQQPGSVHAKETAPNGPITGWQYLALGDSLAFGYQPNNDFTHGYADLLAQRLQNEGLSEYVNMACPGETSTTMNGQCPRPKLRKYPYQGSQLQAAVDYIKQHHNKFSVVTLTIGANDVLPFINPQTCQIDDSSFNSALATLDANLKDVILARLTEAMKVNGLKSGFILVTNYYNPFQNICPKSLPYIETLNQHLANDVQGVGFTVDVFSAFGGEETPNQHICTYTWMCSEYHDIHPTDEGYKVIADAIDPVSLAARK
ncbi:hypothetical protein EPA93_47470 [Ktedonosporobacter rubrisoli]|uniref:Uncharacterized protein n=1 Tax=Ktedonosporobacter rubrisoli TaxID=2509675 RepID=A0A4P6K5P1_KTERU|nr:SGNH/GDSL hydrolase family protein [Ktedonosporobacter rubrisoli]QBD83200.1 hypothetical protein EPA93_47470 [Ktedonosporobacter rubrisoli]